MRITICRNFSMMGILALVTIFLSSTLLTLPIQVVLGCYLQLQKETPYKKLKFNEIKIEGSLSTPEEVGITESDLMTQTGKKRIDEEVGRWLLALTKSLQLRSNYVFFNDGNDKKNYNAYAVTNWVKYKKIYPDGTLLLGKGLVTSGYKTNKYLALTYICHEAWHLQQKKNNSPLKGKARELDADEAAGRLLTEILISEKAPVQNIGNIMNSIGAAFYEHGRYTVSDHGTPGDRQIALLNGHNAAMKSFNNYPVELATTQQPNVKPSTPPTTQPPQTVTRTIKTPEVTKPFENYEDVTFVSGDIVEIEAGGCVQTGGMGKTWKDYVKPLDSDCKESRLYHGLIQLPGYPVQRISDVIGKKIVIPSTIDKTQSFLKLGYEDDDYADNGYWSKDPGNCDQCQSKGNAYVKVILHHQN